MSIRMLFNVLVILFIFAIIQSNEAKKSKKVKNSMESERQIQQNFHEVDAFGDDFVDFGAQTGPKGQFSWHADFPIESPE